jgi:hypothetical protein
MYLTSSAIGYLLGSILVAVGGQRFDPPMRTLVNRTAREHADAAAERQGPYLAPVTFVVILVGMTALGAVLINAAS